MNNKLNNAVLGINKAGTTMYLLNAYEGKKDMEKGLARSTYADGKWSTPVKVDVPGLDIDGDFYGFHVSEDEQVMIISYDGPNSLGLEDLYVSTKSGSSWTTPVHMGNKLNTTGFEISPFLSETKDTLFFSSNGLGGQGDADIFYSVRQGDWTSWSTPVNLGNKINSPKFDAYFIHSGSQAYWSSNRDGALSDIWMVNILKPAPISIACVGTDVTVFGGSDGRVDATVEGGVPPFTFSWSSSQTTEDLSGVVKGEYTVTVTDAIGQTASCSSPVNEPAPIADVQLKHYFEYNAVELTTSNGELKTFVNTVEEQIKSGRDVTITINSSASYVPTKTFKTNDKLARSRADEMEQVLTDYFANLKMSDKLNIEIIGAVVQGPKYEGDFANEEKYKPYQFIELKTK